MHHDLRVMSAYGISGIHHVMFMPFAYEEPTHVHIIGNNRAFITNGDGDHRQCKEVTVANARQCILLRALSRAFLIVGDQFIHDYNKLRALVLALSE